MDTNTFYESSADKTEWFDVQQPVLDWLLCYWPDRSAPAHSPHVSYPRTFSWCWEKWKRKKEKKWKEWWKKKWYINNEALKNWKHNRVWVRQLVFTHFFTGIFPSWFTCSFSFV